MSDFRDALVRDVMQRPVSTIAADTPLLDAARRMREEGVSCLVVDPRDPAEGFGIVTQKDVLGFMADLGLELDDLVVADAMTQPVVSVPASFSVRACLKQMRMLGVRRVVVAEGTELVGFLSFTDVFRFALSG